jgi:undecaprenyl phosphate-alpha-L-ara4N flippase subunit ArnE
MNKQLIASMALMVSSALCSSLGQLFWKMAALQRLPVYCYILGLGLYGAGALLMIAAFRHGHLSILHPMLSCGFIFAILWSVFILREAITAPKLIGIACIITGVIFLSFGNGKEAKNVSAH